MAICASAISIVMMVEICMATRTVSKVYPYTPLIYMAADTIYSDMVHSNGVTMTIVAIICGQTVFCVR